MTLHNAPISAPNCPRCWARCQADRTGFYCDTCVIALPFWGYADLWGHESENKVENYYHSIDDHTSVLTPLEDSEPREVPPWVWSPDGDIPTWPGSSVDDD